MLVIGSNRIDQFVARVTSYFTRFVRSVFHIPNTALAVMLLGSSAGWLIVFLVAEAAQGRQHIGGPLWALALFVAHRQVRHMRLHIEDPRTPSGVVPVPPPCLLGACRYRQIWLVILALNLTPPYTMFMQKVPYMCFLLTGVMAQYVILHIDMGLPKKKSLWSRAKSWLSDHAPSLGPVVAPSPAFRSN